MKAWFRRLRCRITGHVWWYTLFLGVEQWRYCRRCGSQEPWDHVEH